MTKTIPINLIEWQDNVYWNRKRFTVISAGRQSGKTHLCIIIIIQNALQNQGSINWWIAPTFDPAKIAFRRCLTFLNDNGFNEYIKVNRSELRIEMFGSTIQFKSADREEGLRGESVNFIVIDEMGMLKRDAWLYAIRGTITATNADVIFIGTPKGKNLFHELYCKGQDPNETEWTSFQIESRESKYFSDKEWQEVKKLPQRVFEQEYEAKFIDDGGEVFRNVRNCVKGILEPRKHIKKSYFCGIDLAKTVDYTVIVILDNTGHLVYFDRFNSIAWQVQKERITNAAKQYDAYCLIDSTGVGDPILEDLTPYIRAEGFKFSNISKRQLIESLSMAIEREEISFPEIPELINELNIFTFEQTEGGLIRYNAPEGMHDDIVIALALANMAYRNASGMLDIMDSQGKREMQSVIDSW